MNKMMIPSVYCFVFSYLLSFIIVMSSEDWFLVWLGLEINMMSFIMLIYERYSMNCIESCFKYFFIQSLGSAMLISMFYNPIFVNYGIISMILSYKIGAGPFFYWFPCLCSGLKWLSCYVLMFFQSILPLLLVSLFIHWMMWIILLVSMIMGAFGSFNQSSIKQLLAYSSVHHLGWIMLIMMKESINWTLYLVLYGFMLLSIIILLMKNEINDLSMMFMSNNKFWFVMGMLSMAGMPPLLGFFLKWMALLYVKYMLLYIVLLIMISVIMLYIYMRMIYDLMMMMKSESSWTEMNYNKFNLNYDMFSIMGISFGIFVGIMVVY